MKVTKPKVTRGSNRCVGSLMRQLNEVFSSPAQSHSQADLGLTRDCLLAM